MSTERYRVQKIDEMPEIINVQSESNVAPFPVRQWQEPLPIAVEGRPLSPHSETSELKKSVERFYPPLLFFSTALTGVFLYLYVTKPVIVDSPLSSVPAMSSETAAPLALASEVEALAPVEELEPFPEESVLPGESLAQEVSAPLALPTNENELFSTSLLAEQMIELESLNDDLEEYSVSLPVFYPQGVSAWSEDSITEAHRLANEMETHLERVRALQSEGLLLLEDWNALVEDSRPKEVLNASAQ